MNQTIRNDFRVPKGFKAVKGLTAAKTIAEPQFAKTAGPQKGAKKRGLIYEQRVTRLLNQHFVGISGLWFEFVDQKGHRYAQADWVGFDWTKGRIYLVEAKLSRVPKAWWQLNRLYLPLVEFCFGRGNICLIEVATDLKHVQVPGPVNLISELEAARPGETSFMRVPYDC